MKPVIKSLLACAVVGTAVNLNAQIVTVDPGTLTFGYMNWTPYSQNTVGASGASSWGTADLVSSFSGTTLTLSPNSINDPATYWYIGGGAPGNPGGQAMDANLYNDSLNSNPGTTLTFTGNVLANSLLGQTDSLGHGWTSVAFIKDFAPDYSSFTQTTVSLGTLGVFSISQTTSANAGDHIQYGFETIGPDVWATDLGNFGNIQIAAVPEPTTLALAGLGGATLLALIRRRK